MNKLSVHIYGHEFEVHVPKEKEQLYLLAAEYVDKKIDAYMDAFVRIPLPQKSTQAVLLMAMLDIVVDAAGLAPAMTRAHFDTPLMNEASQLNQSAEPAGSAVEADWGVKSSGRESTDT